MVIFNPKKRIHIKRRFIISNLQSRYSDILNTAIFKEVVKIKQAIHFLHR